MTEQSNDLTEQGIEALIADLNLTNAKIELANTNPLTTTVIDVMKGLRECQKENKELIELIAELDNTLDATNDMINEMKNKIISLGAENEELQECNDNAVNRILELANERDNLKSENEHLKTDAKFATILWVTVLSFASLLEICVSLCYIFGK